jgi:hypothetical protein
MHRKMLIAALSVPGIWDATEAVSQLARNIRAQDRSLKSSDLIHFLSSMAALERLISS